MQFFAPEPFLKGLPFARELLRRGHEVEVLTGFPNFPGGQVYPGYKIRLWQREVIEGVSILRVPLFPSHDRSAIRRIANYLSFALSASIGSLFVKRPDVIYVYHPPATVGLPAMVARRFHHVPIVYDIQDLWPDTVATTGMMNSRLVLRLLDSWCRLVYRKSDRIIVLSHGFKDALVQRGVPEAKIDVIYNWCDEASITANSDRPMQLGTPDQFTVLFAGMMGLAQGLDSVLEAARICSDSVPNAKFVFVGFGVERERLKRKAADMALENVEFLGSQPIDQIGRYLAGANCLLVHLKDDPLFRITIPSKTQAYLAAGKPVLMAVRGDAADLILRSGGGLVCEPQNPAGIAAAVSTLASTSSERLAELGRAGRSFYLRELALGVGVDQFERAFCSVLQ
jgi:glycosyltransferase involved in cell wall biosynthesis